MRAFTLDRLGAQPSLRDDIAEPQLGDNELLVRVKASSVNPADVFIAAGALNVHDGSWTELITVPEDNFVAAKPGHLGFAHSGAAPLAAITAIAAIDALAPGQGATVVVIGATGAVGR